jgi:hypothetical protein
MNNQRSLFVVLIITTTTKYVGFFTLLTILVFIDSDFGGSFRYAVLFFEYW